MPANASQPPTGAGHAEFTRRSWPADLGQLGHIRDAVRQWLAPLAMTEVARADVLLAVDEAVSNSIEHAYPSGIDHAVADSPMFATEASALDAVALTLWTEADALYIEVVDHGTWQPPTSSPAARGLGIPLMQRVVEAVLIHYDPRGTRVMLRHRLPGEAVPAPNAATPPLVPGIG